MCTRKGNPIVLMLVLVVSMSSCARGAPYAANVADLNGTWVAGKGLLSSSRIRERDYSWGVGKRIVDGTLEIELEVGIVRIPGDGRFHIQRISRDSDASVTVDLKGPGEEGGWELRLVFHFLDRDTFWLESAELDESWGAIGRNRPWYRLSGPPR